MKKDSILITGACGQLGTELGIALQNIHGNNAVIFSDIRRSDQLPPDALFENLDTTQSQDLAKIVEKYQITQIYHLAAILSAKGEQMPLSTWKINMDSLLNVLEIGREKKLNKIYFPSSIAAFGTNTPKENTQQDTIMHPNTVYGISKLTGELWAQYYFQKYGLDVRSLRYPGLISYKTLPGGGTTDYAVDIYFKAIQENQYTCFLSENTYLPMMYMPDAVRGTIELMEAEYDKIQTRTAYNLGAMSFSPKEVAQAIQKLQPAFSIQYAPDHRQAIADSWPRSLDDSRARQEWQWQPQYDLNRMTEDMLKNIALQLGKTLIKQS
ncbi:MAG: NAD-dependent epimerase/dehydratase family protein [Cytophagales bacterium]|nr:MAG: NAD-dependent epimerase/dehydratase family protein [Cytophagales bacterium]